MILKYLRPAALLLFSISVLIAHFATPTTHHHSVLHVLYQRILYVPIVLAAFWYGWRGGVAASLIITIGYLPHISLDWGGYFFTSNLNQTLEIVMYFVVAILTGCLIDRLRKRETDLFKANERLSDQSRQLRQAIDSLTIKTREVFEIEEQLRRSDRLAALGQISAGLAHEIRNPLGSIRGVAEIFSDKDVSPQQREKFSKILIEETERLDRVLEDFLNYSRSKRQEDTGSATCDLKATLTKSLDLIRKEASSKRIVIECAIPAEQVEVAIEENLLQQALLNLLLNSIQAMPNGGSIRIEAIADDDRKSIQISISDTGPGIPKDLIDEIFDPFFTTKPQGTGLGLSIVQKILDNHEGSIAVDTNYTAGARFVINLPLLGN